MAYGKFPLRNLLKGKLLKIAELQDKLIVEMTSRFEIVLHGGTAIWRIYKGKRFSFDIDVYYRNPSEISKYFGKSTAFNMIRSKLTSSDVLYARFQENNVMVEINASPLFKKLRTTDGQFYLVDGDTITLKTLSPTELVKEKINAFKTRKKGRDLYDIYYLLDAANIPQIKNNMKTLLPLLKTPPKDFPGLREQVLVGKVPDFETITRKVRKYAKG
jgi:predicted nucleotidyltransferase component of viral defense system